MLTFHFLLFVSFISWTGIAIIGKGKNSTEIKIHSQKVLESFNLTIKNFFKLLELLLEETSDSNKTGTLREVKANVSMAKKNVIQLFKVEEKENKKRA